MLTQASRLAIVFIMLLGFAQIEAEDLPKGIIMPNYKRQVAGTGNSPSSTPDPTSDTPDPTPSSSNGGGGGGSSDDSTTTEGSTSVVRTTSIPTTVQVTTTNADGSTVTSEVSTNTVQRTTATVQNSIVSGDKTTFNAATLTKATVVRSPLVSSKTVKSTYTSYWTTNGVVHSSVVTTNVVVPTTTGFAQTTIQPGLAEGGSSGSGLSGNTKAVIGGVVGGIGGAALIGGIAFVLWRVYGKKKQESRYSDQYEKYSSGNRESTMTYGGSSTYSSYGGRVNTASNF